MNEENLNKLNEEAKELISITRDRLNAVNEKVFDTRKDVVLKKVDLLTTISGLSAAIIGIGFPLINNRAQKPENELSHPQVLLLKAALICLVLVILLTVIFYPYIVSYISSVIANKQKELLSLSNSMVSSLKKALISTSVEEKKEHIAYAQGLKEGAKTAQDNRGKSPNVVEIVTVVIPYIFAIGLILLVTVFLL